MNQDIAIFGLLVSSSKLLSFPQTFRLIITTSQEPLLFVVWGLSSRKPKFIRVGWLFPGFLSLSRTIPSNWFYKYSISFTLKIFSELKVGWRMEKWQDLERLGNIPNAQYRHNAQDNSEICCRKESEPSGSGEGVSLSFSRGPFGPFWGRHVKDVASLGGYGYGSVAEQKGIGRNITSV